MLASNVTEQVALNWDE